MTLVVPHSACPDAFVNKSYNVMGPPGQGVSQTMYYESWERTPASCGTTACAQPISRINDMALSDLKTGFKVRVSIYIPD